MSRLLVDTHALLWWLSDDPKLNETARAAIADPARELLVSSATLWEIAIKRSLDKLVAPDDLPDLILAEGFAYLPVEPDHAWEVHRLPPHHRDPFDRMLIAQARVEHLPILTRDGRFAAYGVEVCW